MDRTPTILDLLNQDLVWLANNLEYRDDMKGGKNCRAVTYNRIHCRFVRKLMDYVKDDNQKLIDIYERVKSKNIDPEVRIMILDYLSSLGRLKQIVYFNDTRTIKTWLKT